MELSCSGDRLLGYFEQNQSVYSMGNLTFSFLLFQINNSLIYSSHTLFMANATLIKLIDEGHAINVNLSGMLFKLMYLQNLSSKLKAEHFYFSRLHLNSFTTTKFLSANFQKNLSPSYIILRIQRLEGKQCRTR